MEPMTKEQKEFVLRLIPMGEDLMPDDIEKAEEAVRKKGFIVTSDMIFHAIDPTHWKVVEEENEADLFQGDYYSNAIMLKAVSPEAIELIRQLKDYVQRKPDDCDNPGELHTMDLYRYIDEERSDLFLRDAEFTNEFFGTTFFE